MRYVLVALVGALLLPGPARACTVLPDDFVVIADVTPDGLIWASGFPTTTPMLELAGPDGTIALDLVEMTSAPGGLTFLALRPQDRLTVGETYTLEGGLSPRSFVVVEAVPPRDVPELWGSTLRSEFGDSCQGGPLPAGTEAGGLVMCLTDGDSTTLWDLVLFHDESGTMLARTIGSAGAGLQWGGRTRDGVTLHARPIAADGTRGEMQTLRLSELPNEDGSRVTGNVRCQAGQWIVDEDGAGTGGCAIRRGGGPWALLLLPLALLLRKRR